MNHKRLESAASGKRRRPQNAVERIDAFLLRHRGGISADRIDLIRRRLFGQVPEVEPVDPSSNAERIRAMRQAYFADVDAWQRSGKIQLPR